MERIDVIRSEFCEISDISVPTFNTHRRGGNLPFDVAKYEQADARGRVWVRYNIHAAARMIAAATLASAQGVTWSQACEILRAENIGCGDFARPFDVGGVHVARAEYRTRSGDAPERMAGPFQVYQGRIEAIGAAVAAEVAGYNARPDVEPIEAVSLVSVNLSQAYQIAFARADALGIERGGDGQMEPDT
jgi:hypothetical protein